MKCKIKFRIIAKLNLSEWCMSEIIKFIYYKKFLHNLLSFTSISFIILINRPTINFNQLLGLYYFYYCCLRYERWDFYRLYVFIHIILQIMGSYRLGFINKVCLLVVGCLDYRVRIRNHRKGRVLFRVNRLNLWVSRNMGVLRLELLKYVFLDLLQGVWLINQVSFFQLY